MASKSKIKGKSGERILGKIFNSIFGGEWIRISGSGSFVGGENSIRTEKLSHNQTKSLKADIMPPDGYDIVLEVKSYGDFPWHKLIFQEKISILENWLDEIYNCIEEDDFWLLCVKINYKGWFVVYEKELNFSIKNHSIYKSEKHNKEYIITGPIELFLKENREKIQFLSSKTNS